VKLFRKSNPDPEALVQERWQTRFGWLQARRLPEERAADYRSFVLHGCFHLEILKPDCFAWVTGPYKYRDLVLEATLDFDPGNPHCAAGFVLRYLNEENFYYFLVSDRGSFRFDVVFNKNPIHLIEWTPFAGLAARPLELRVLARGDGFHFFADDQWIGEMSDATISEGACGFAGQNYSGGGRAGFRLLEYALESRPVEVEKAYYRWVHFLPAAAANRLQLARTFHGMGRYLEALVELKKAFRQGAGGAEERRLQADACLALKLNEEALEALAQSLELEPDNEEALLAKASTLFQCRRFLEARDFIAALLPRFPRDAALANLAGACEYSLGNWERALDDYRRAAELAPESPSFLGNLARVLERLGRGPEALQAYLQAARLLFRSETYDELSLVLARGRALACAGGASAAEGPEARELEAYEAKMLFHENKLEEAARLLGSLVRADYPDPAVHYLYGLVLIGRGARGEAEGSLLRATELDPSFPLYWFRLAENRYLLGRDPGEALERAFALDPEDPWINNLKGQLVMGQGRNEEALEHFRRALAKAPGEADLAANAAGALVRLGRAAEAVEMVTAALEAAGQPAVLYTARGNARVATRDFTAALRDYEQALALDPDNPDYLANAAGCCLELDMVLRAEELLDRLLEVAPTAAAYNLVGNLAVVQQDQLRAELAYQEALSKDPGNPEVTLNLVSLYLAQGGYAKARETLAPVLEQHPELPRARELEKRIRETFERELACAGCDRRWWVPRELPPQSAFKVRGEPPGEAPAGRCATCGKLYCIACASPHAQEGQLLCPSCGGRLRLAEDALKYLFLRYLPDSLPDSG
jgi:tetratricopeptide (TPR) repeat protein